MLRILLRCSAGHEQELTATTVSSREHLKLLSGLLDGTSFLCKTKYDVPCCICGESVIAKVEDTTCDSVSIFGVADDDLPSAEDSLNGGDM